MRRHEDWLKQADSDLCAAEKALKALIISKGSESRIHSIKFLLSNLPENITVSDQIQNAAHERASDFFSDSLPVQPFVMTHAELVERIDKLDFLVFDAFEDGSILYSDMDMDTVNERLKASKERFSLKRVKSGWNFDAVAADAAGI